ncbi:MAG: NAD(P)/FAD-dependent oxidoreductase [Chloroflexi bacterium]|nr:NAD(P)/FAD-dependent oxidoreductase [Chloroflexota bacterium]
MHLDCDVAVVGAGPAGSRTARDLARAGLRVRLLEEHRAIGVPSHCSGLISLRTLREAEIGEEAVLHRLTGAFVHTQEGGEVALGGSATQAVAIDRVAWDETLCQQAQAAGADLVRARMTRVERENHHVRLTAQTDGRDWTLTARMVVGADGTHSRVARTLGMPRPTEYAYNLGIEGRISPDARARWRDDYVHVFVGHDLAPGWFGWIIPTGEGPDGRGIVRVGIGTTGAVKPIVAYRRMAEAFPELFASLEPIRMYGGTIPLAFAPRSYGDHVLLVGDAAGQVKPFSGGGIYTSLVAARHAAISVREAFERDAFGAKSLVAYERRWKREIGRELSKSRHLRHFGLAMSGAQVERLVRALRSPGLQALTDRHADIDYPSKVLLRLARSLPALATLGAVTLRRPGAALNLVRAHLPI